MMPRNLDRRVEAMLRVADRRLRARLDEILELNFADDALAWSLEADGTWVEGARRCTGSTRRSRCRSSRSRGRRRAASTADRDRSPRACACPTSSARRWRRRSPGSTPTSRRSGPSAIPKPCTRRASRPAGCAPTCARCATSSTPRWAPQLRGELRWLGAELGAVRDIEVLRERLALHAGLLPDAEADAAASARSAGSRPTTTRARADLLRALRQPRYAQLHRALHDAVDRAPAHSRRRHAARSTRCPARCGRRGGGCGARSTTLATGAVRRRAARGAHPRQAVPLRRRAREPGDRPAGARPRASRSTRVQDVLGEHQDAVVADALARQGRARVQPAGGVRARDARRDRTRLGRARARRARRARGTRRARRSLRAWL